MRKVKIFETRDIAQLEALINKFLLENPGYSVLDIKIHDDFPTTTNIVTFGLKEDKENNFLMETEFDMKMQQLEKLENMIDSIEDKELDSIIKTFTKPCCPD